MRSKGYLLPLLFPFLLALSVPVKAQHSETEGSLIDPLFDYPDLFSENVPLNITLVFDQKDYQRSKRTESHIPVHLIYKLCDSLVIERSMTIRARGEFRKNNCYLAPYWLIDQQTGENDSTLQDVNRVKVVTRCRESKAFTDYLLKEYLAYKIYNILSPVSFRVRLIRMKYVDTARKNKATDSWAFMIEPEEMLAARLSARIIKNDQLGMVHMDPATMDLVAMFQFMMGNPDYSIKGRHNIKILGLPGYGTQGYSPVPYDFDYTGIVNASLVYRLKNWGSGPLQSAFLGPCRNEEQVEQPLRK